MSKYKFFPNLVEKSYITGVVGSIALYSALETELWNPAMLQSS